MKDLYIIGAGGFGREVAWLVDRINNVEPTWLIKGYIDDDKSLWGHKENKYEVVGGCEYLETLEDAYVVCAIGSSIVRKKIVEKVKKSNIKFATIVDPSVIMSERVDMGEGTIICAGTILTVDIKIGNHVIINLNCTVGHDVIINDYVSVFPDSNISGNVLIGSCSELGTGMQIIQGKTIHSNTVIGAGTVVCKDLIESGTYVGNPSKKIG